MRVDGNNPQESRIQKPEHSKKQPTHETAKNGSMDTLGASSNALFSLKITTIPEIVHIRLRASKITARASKMKARASKVIEN